jgi:hypothetical protein
MDKCPSKSTWINISILHIYPCGQTFIHVDGDIYPCGLTYLYMWMDIFIHVDLDGHLSMWTDIFIYVNGHIDPCGFGWTYLLYMWIDIYPCGQIFIHVDGHINLCGQTYLSMWISMDIPYLGHLSLFIFNKVAKY